MSDQPIDDQPNSEDPEPSASAIFAELMQQAAEKAVPGRSKPRAPHVAAKADRASAAAEQVDAASAPAQSRKTPDEQPQIRRISPRLALRRPHPSSAAGGFLGTIFVVVVSTGLVATLLMFFVNPEFLNPAVVQGLQLDREEIIARIAARPTPVQTPQWLRRIGILSGHRGKRAESVRRDSGAICKDEYGNVYLEEVDINFAVATRVVANLEAMNFNVELLDEYDGRLVDYRADALISIHANSCIDYGELVTGFIVAQSEARPEGGVDTFLRECIAINYGALIPLERSFILTADMTDNHAWHKIHPNTPGVILEMGFMLADQEVLTQQHDMLAHAITQGILCFIENVDASPAQQQSAIGSRGYHIPIIATATPAFRR